MDTPDLNAALDAARSGDERAVSLLFRALHPQLLHYVRHRAPDVAEDLVSDTWLAAAKGFPQFEGDVGDFRAWLFCIARRRVADHYRARARRPQLVPLDEVTHHVSADAADVALEALSTDEAIEALVRDLPADQAEVVLLRVVAGLSVDQVSKVLGRSAGSVRVVQHRALRRLSKIWEPRTVTR